MALSAEETVLLESFRDYLTDKLKDPLPVSDDDATDDNNFSNRGFEYHHRHINEMFAMKMAGAVHHTGLCAAFTKVHDYKYLDDLNFPEALKKELTAQAIPVAEQQLAFDAIGKIINELKKESKIWAEKDFGFSPDLDEIMHIEHDDVDNEPDKR